VKLTLQQKLFDKNDEDSDFKPPKKATCPASKEKEKKKKKENQEQKLPNDDDDDGNIEPLSPEPNTRIHISSPRDVETNGTQTSQHSCGVIEGSVEVKTCWYRSDAPNKWINKDQSASIMV
jgi:hypothetical protein